MNRIEIVHLRSSRESLESLRDRIKESIRGEGCGSDVVTLYRRHGLETDVAIHIRQPEAPGVEGPSRIGLHLAAALSAFGLVKHTVWEEI